MALPSTVRAPGKEGTFSADLSTLLVVLGKEGYTHDMEKENTQTAMPELPQVQLARVPGAYAVLRLRADEPVPAERQGAFYSITRTERETSVVLDEELVPPGGLAETGFALFRVKGELDFSLTGVMAALSLPLATAGISLFALSTFDTDWLLVREESVPDAVAAWQGVGHLVDV